MDETKQQSRPKVKKKLNDESEADSDITNNIYIEILNYMIVKI